MNKKLEDYLLQVIRGHKQGFIAWLILFLFTLLSNIYYLGIKFRTKLYQWGFKEDTKLPCRVISVGNITMGGTGKTPIVEYLAKKFKQRGRKVVVLNRGYKADFTGEVGVVSDGTSILMEGSQAGDEALMLAQRLEGVPIIIGSNRVVTGDYACREFEAEILILDDGFQHWPLARDVDVVVIDATNPFSNGYVIPRGILREPLSSLERADIFLLSKVDQAPEEKLAEIKDKLNKYNPQALIFETAYRPSYLRNLEGSVKLAAEFLARKRVIAVSGIGNPASFEQTLEDLGVELVKHTKFEDHHRYTKEELVDIFSEAAAKGVELIVTTEKDAASIEAELVEEIKGQGIDFRVLGIEVEVKTEEVRMDSLLTKMEGR
ncbi:tetraacyldisaccharide 4'-kinase [Fuchsiella alkaliacetigena]|uniref:tetraacyldisaccharide 4'-kinase n=1 Tax=Fuchsiella alkaliacetigena TaxID=957042 RepID=UPI00200A84A2|nr:tetraacyldisaccharide 4'-kinase [Fuchsiella alkaliacetigena]MCK8824275.1 tetraacyldisaccharide 4'-kinase [Fuchsiella alkaliacetigena]